MKAVQSKSLIFNTHSRNSYRLEVYCAWLIIGTLFVAIGLELFPWTVVLEGTFSCLALACVGFCLHRFYKESQKNFAKEQYAKTQLIITISEHYPWISCDENTLEQIIQEQLAAQSCSQKRLALLAYYRHHPTAMKDLLQQLRSYKAQNRVLTELGLNWPYPSTKRQDKSLKHK